MIAFLIVLAVVIVLVASVLSVSATFTVIYDGDWCTTVKILWIEKEIELTKILSFILFPEKKADEVKKKKDKKSSEKETKDAEADIKSENKIEEKKPAKQNYIKEIWQKEGIVGIMNFFTNLFQTASDAVITLFKGFHIYSLYVKILVGGGDAAQIAQSYGRVCKYYYPLKGAVLNGMKVDNYDDWIAPDFIAPKNEYGMQFIGSVSVAVILRVLLSAGKTFLLNLIKNK